MDSSGKINALGEQYIGTQMASNGSSSPGVTVSGGHSRTISWTMTAFAALLGISIS